MNPEIIDDEVVNLLDIKIPFADDRFSTGYNSLDEIICGGFSPGQLVCISGISDHGKTALAMTLTYNLTKKSIPCLWFSFEWPVPKLVAKFLEMGVDRESFYAYSPRINSSGRLDWVKRKIREGLEKFLTKVIFIDDLTFLTPTGFATANNRAAYLEEICVELKSIAVELNIIIILMAHVTKLSGDSEPEMQSLKDSSGVYQKADTVLMIYRIPAPRKKLDEVSGDLYTDEAKIKVVKNRDGGVKRFFKVRMVNHRLIELS